MTINTQRKDDEKWDSKSEKQILFNFLSCEIHRKASTAAAAAAHNQNPSAGSYIRLYTLAGGKLDTVDV